MTTLAQGTLRRNGSTGVVQQGVRQGTKYNMSFTTTSRLFTSKNELMVDGSKQATGFKWRYAGVCGNGRIGGGVGL
jgi:hypothetical protein